MNTTTLPSHVRPIETYIKSLTAAVRDGTFDVPSTTLGQAGIETERQLNRGVIERLLSMPVALQLGGQTEIGNGGLEWASLPHTVDEAGLNALDVWIETIHTVEQRLAKLHGAFALRMGLCPGISPDKHHADEHISPLSPRYQEIKRGLLALFPEKSGASWVFPGGEGAELRDALFWALQYMFGWQLTTECTEGHELGRRYNIYAALSPLWMLLDANSSILPGGAIGGHVNRSDCWPAAVTHRLSGLGVGYLPEDETALETWFCRLLRWDEGADADRHPMVIQGYENESGEFLSRLYTSTVWHDVRPRVVPGSREGTQALLVEGRATDTQPTRIDQRGSLAHTLGSLLGYMARGPAQELVPDWQTANSNREAVIRYGWDARIDWMGRTQVPVFDVINDDYIPTVRKGLRERGIDEDRLYPVLARISARQTGSDAAKKFIVAARKAGWDWEFQFTRLVQWFLDNAEADTPVANWQLPSDLMAHV